MFSWSFYGQKIFNIYVYNGVRYGSDLINVLALLLIDLDTLHLAVGEDLFVLCRGVEAVDRLPH